MGKRERRRKRERAKRQRSVPTAVVTEFPPAAPRIRVIVQADQPAEAREIALKYWEVAEDGKWARTVASIGEQQAVSMTATSASHAVLLGSLCASCDEPIRVPNRSWAVKVGGPNLDRRSGTYLCPECSEVQEQERLHRRQAEAEAAQAVQKQEEARAAERDRKIAELIAREGATSSSESSLPGDASLGLSLYIALVNHAAYRADKPLPSVTEVAPAGWTGDSTTDGEAFLDLYRAHLVAIAAETPVEAFVVSDEDDGVRFYRTEARWRLVGSAAFTTATAESITAYLVTGHGPGAHEARQSLAGLVERMETINVISYLDGLLTKKYDYPPVPEGRRQELADVVKKGLAAGYTPGQMICFAWRAADSAAGWKERNAHMGPAEASSGAVTILNGKIDNAIELHHAIPEYDSPRWHQQPLALGALREVNAEARRIRDRAVIDACAVCDHQGLSETDTGTLVRCLHAPDPRQDGAANV